MKFHVVFRRKGEKEIIAGDGYIVDQPTEAKARQEVRQLLKHRFFSTEVPKIAWVNIIKEPTQ